MRVIKRLRYINHYRDRHGRQRYYFRRGREPQIALPGEPGSAEFAVAYEAALNKPRIRELGKDRSPGGTLGAIIAAYYQHNMFTGGKSHGTLQGHRQILERFREAHGEKPIAMLKQEHLVEILGALKPFAQRNWLKVLRGLMKYAVAVRACRADPTLGIERAKAKPGSRHTWTESEIAQYLARHAKGTRAYTALVLLLYTGQRSSDVRAMGPNSLQDGRMWVKQQKTGKEVLIKMHAVLRELIDGIMAQRPAGVIELRPLPFLQKSNGGGYDRRTVFTNMFRTWCDEAGLPKECSAHGLRKAMCRRLAEARNPARTIMAITGHESLSEVERYCREAEQILLGDRAIDSLSGLGEIPAFDKVPGWPL